MRIRLGDELPEPDALLGPDAEPDASQVGVNYADAYLRTVKRTLEDGRKLSCRRRGLKLTLAVGERSGEGLLRRLDHGPDVRDVLREALREAARGLGGELATGDGSLSLILEGD